MYIPGMNKACEIASHAAKSVSVNIQAINVHARTYLCRTEARDHSQVNSFLLV